MRIDTISVDNAIRELCARGMEKLNYRYLHSIKRLKKTSKRCQGHLCNKFSRCEEKPKAEFKVVFGMGNTIPEYRKFFSIYMCCDCLAYEKDTVKRYVSSCVDIAFRWENEP